MTQRIVTPETIEAKERVERKAKLRRRITPPRDADEAPARFHEVLHGDCLERLKTLESNSVHSVVTDPPAGISFMGKSWDDDKGGRDEWIKWLTGVMAECLRVLKPGGHAVVWALPRTSHWTAKAIEDAGFEIRDVITHHFGCGMPKSQNVGLFLDKRAGAKRNVIGERQAVDIRGGNLVAQDRSVKREKMAYQITEPSTADAKKWAGWGTGLKPASEHWVLARKPLEMGTLAQNVKRFETGAINIDECKVGGTSRRGDSPRTTATGWNAGHGKDVTGAGRWPANLLLSHSPECRRTGECGEDDVSFECAPDCAIKALDAMGGYTVSRPSAGTGRVNEGQWVYGKGLGGSPSAQDDEGHISRYFNRFEQEPAFFYCPKPTSAERNAGCEKIEPKMKNDGFMDGIVDAEGRNCFVRTEFHNFHPTVKSIRLMSHFVKLVTPPGGIVLDPFAGSGTTLVAAKRIGRSAIGIEREYDYWRICKARLENGGAYI